MAYFWVMDFYIIIIYFFHGVRGVNLSIVPLTGAGLEPAALGTLCLFLLVRFRSPSLPFFSL